MYETEVWSYVAEISRENKEVFGIPMEPSILIPYVKEKLQEIQASLLNMAISFRDSNIVDVSSYNELKEAISVGMWARGPWSASDEDELKVKKLELLSDAFLLSTPKGQ